VSFGILTQDWSFWTSLYFLANILVGILCPGYPGPLCKLWRVSEHWTGVNISCRLYRAIEEVHNDYTEGLLHPGDLKTALAKALNKILEVKYSDILCGLRKTIASFSKSFQWWQTILCFEWVLIAAGARSFQEQCWSEGLIEGSQGIVTSVSLACWNYMGWFVIFGLNLLVSW